MKSLLAFAGKLFALRSDSGDRAFACNMAAWTSTERARHQELTRALVGAVKGQRELHDGYAFQLPSASLMTAAEWVSLEHRCCPFFKLELDQGQGEGPLWLRITGSSGVKAFIREELGL